MLMAATLGEEERKEGSFLLLMLLACIFSRLRELLMTLLVILIATNVGDEAYN